ncbi:fungal-specific transcription factor domain-containing protein [Mycotypha africana]|uniref:fungal-specific transcription factor domain-containing protein n=1 Tax=Mycotypha africana TaxID=64632 RepID=UPI002300C051|nr:fungal-specific transcription factor domain-containing protein [Mycotypha africana]KAI8968880.1 fungal-specific transcription factor domain-containing protein [Mycotypha africana]
MTPVATMKHDLENKKEQKPKRFKVGRACYTCRVKKIKCDGLQPCMQCKARRRTCTFSKDGSIDTNAVTIQTLENSSPSPTTSKDSSPSLLPHHASPPSTTHATPTDTPLSQQQIVTTTEILIKLTKSWPGEGKEGKWEIDHTKLQEQFYDTPRVNIPSSSTADDANSYGVSFLPSKPVQLQLIESYYTHCYFTFPIIPKRLLFEQLNSPTHCRNTTSNLIDPLLLLMIIAHGAQTVNSEDADSYFLHARALLLDNALNVPKLSTAAALALMCLYESPKNRRPNMYGALAVQMCIDLDLMRDYSGNTINKTAQLEQQHDDDNENSKELRKRICWGCYTIDKVCRLQSGQPWMLRSNDIELDMPLLQPGDDATENNILQGFVATIKLMQIAERFLHPGMSQKTGQSLVRPQAYDQLFLNSDNDLLHWLRSLPTTLQWTLPSISTSNSIPHPTLPSNPVTCYLHILYNLVELYVLKPYFSSTARSIRQRSAVNATNITRLTAALVEQTTLAFNFEFVTRALMESILFHLRDCSYENLNLARNARFMFQQSMQTMKLLLSTVKIPSTTRLIVRFISALSNVINEADEHTAAIFTSINEEDIMTPFVLGSLNARYAEEERQQWSKLDYYANGLITPPNVKSKSITMSSNMFAAPPSTHTFHGFSSHYASSNYNSLSNGSSNNSAALSQWKASTVTKMNSEKYQYSTKTPNLDFLNETTQTSSSGHTQQQQNQRQAWQRITNNNKASVTPSVNNNKLTTVDSYSHPQTPSDLLLTHSTNPTDIAAFVAQMQDSSNTNTNGSRNQQSNLGLKQGDVMQRDDWSSSSTPNQSAAARNATATSSVNSDLMVNENDNLLYSFLSEQRTRNSVTPTSTSQQQQQQPQQHQQQQQRQQTATNRPQYNTAFVQPSYMSIGLGIYASAHQHHNDVIKQHLPNNTINSNKGLAFTDTASSNEQQQR